MLINHCFNKHKNKPLLIVGCGPSMTNELDVAAPALAKMGIDVYNLSKQSKLDCWLKPDTNIWGALRWLSQQT